MILRATLRDFQRVPTAPCPFPDTPTARYHLHLIRRDERGGLFLPSSGRPRDGAASAFHSTHMSIPPREGGSNQQRSAV